MKSIRLLAIGLMCLLATFAAYANGNRESSSSSGTSPNASQPRTLTVWHYFSAPSQVQAMKDEAALFNKSEPNVKVDNVYIPYNQLSGKVIAASGADTGPDVFIDGGDWGAITDAGAIADMTPYWDAFPAKSQFSKALMLILNGKIYAVQGYVNLLGLWYNKDILGKLGVNPPSTIAELTSDLKKAKAAGYIGITLTGQPNDQGEWQAYPWMTAEGWSYHNPQASALAKTFGLVQSWAQNGYLPMTSVTWGQTQPFQKFLVGNVAFAENGNWQMGAAKKATFSYGVVPMPSGVQDPRVYVGGEKMAIGAFSKQKKLAFTYLEDTFFSKQGELITLKDVGSIPGRKDALNNTAITSNPLLAPFAKEVRDWGAPFPPAIATITKANNAELGVAQEWSAAIAGQKSPSAAAADAVAKVKSALGS